MLEVTVKIEGFDEDGKPTADVQSEIIDGVIRRLTEHIERDVKSRIDDMANGIINKAIASRVTESVDEMLLKCIQPTNRWGEKQGESISLVEFIASKGSEYLNAEVNARGDSPSYNDTKIKRADWIARKMSEEQLSKELKPQIDAAVKEAKSFMANKVAVALKEAMLKAIS